MGGSRFASEDKDEGFPESRKGRKGSERERCRQKGREKRGRPAPPPRPPPPSARRWVESGPGALLSLGRGERGRRGPARKRKCVGRSTSDPLPDGTPPRGLWGPLCFSFSGRARPGPPEHRGRYSLHFQGGRGRGDANPGVPPEPHLQSSAPTAHISGPQFSHVELMLVKGHPHPDVPPPHAWPHPLHP